MFRVYLAWIFLCISTTVGAERYYVEKDGFGNFDAVKAEEGSVNKSSTKTEKPDSASVSKESEGLVEDNDRSISKSDQQKLPEKPRSNVSTISAEALPGSVTPANTSEEPPKTLFDEAVDNSSESVQTQNDDFLSSVPSEEIENSLLDSGLIADSEVGEAGTADVNLQGAIGVFGGNADKDLRNAETGDNSGPEETETTAIKPRKLSKFEQVFLDSEGQNPYDATVIDDGDFVDGDQLLQGRAVSDNERPFFITKDQDGNESVTFYSPSLARQQAIDAENSIKFSAATVFSKSDSSKGASFEIPESAEPLALKLLSSGGENLQESYFESFSKNCCRKLPRNYVKELVLGRSALLELSRDLLTFRFSEGDSRYLIVKLPESETNLALEVRAFISKYEEQGVPFGVFFPQIVTLSPEFEALRIISDPVLEYSPETWSNYGYLEGVFEIDTEVEEEKYILIHTTRNTLRRRSTFEHPQSPITLKHMGYGSLGVKASTIAAN